jgi:hypothetical protein
LKKSIDPAEKWVRSVYPAAAKGFFSSVVPVSNDWGIAQPANRSGEEWNIGNFPTVWLMSKSEVGDPR